MGTYYNIKYTDEQGRNFKKEINQLLIDFDQSLSTYNKKSIISAINNAPVNQAILVDDYFIKVFTRAKAINVESNGAFEPTIMPLVYFWGFSAEKKMRDKINATSKEKANELLDLIGMKHFKMDKIDAQKTAIKKLKANAQLDFNAIAKGYGVDVLCEYLATQQITNYMVEIGGEVRTSGVNHQQQKWKVGIDKPTEQKGKREIEEIVVLQNKAMASSGNYRNYYEKDGQKYVHTINPKTGYPEMSNLLSASVFAPDCMTADAYATAFMVMGFKKAMTMTQQNKNLEALFIYGDEQGVIQTVYTSGVEVIK